MYGASCWRHVTRPAVLKMRVLLVNMGYGGSSANSVPGAAFGTEQFSEHHVLRWLQQPASCAGWQVLLK